MFTSKRGLFSSEHGATTSWLAGITSAALLVAGIALPSVALDEGATPEPIVAAEEVAAADEATAEETPAEETPAEEAAPAEEAVVDEPPAEEAAAEEAVIDVPLEDEVVDEPAPAVAEEPAPPADEPVSEEPAPVEEKATASSTDGDTPDINSPPVEEYVPGVKVETTSDSATIAWPEFGLDDNYVVQQEKKDGTWKTLDATVEPSDTRDYEATIDGLKEGKDYTLRIVTADTEALAESATEDAVDASVAGPGLGSLARAASNGSPDVVVSNEFTITIAAATRDPGDPFIQGQQVNTTLEGCRANTSSYIRVPASGPFKAYICDDAEYTPGNLGKGWNELDLVPHRLTTSLGEQSDATTVYDVIIAADSALGSYEGYDVVTVPVVNAGLSDDSCTIDVTDQGRQAGLTGGVDDGVYRIARITQDKGTTCVFDYDLRLSNTAADFSGSSLQAYMFQKSDFSTGKKTVPIPVGEVEPQELFKESTAVQGRTVDWTIKKSSDPSELTWGDTCSPDGLDREVKIEVEWTKGQPTATGQITYNATITASNPSRRDVRVTVTDEIYGVSGATETSIDSIDFAPVVVPKGGAEVVVGEITNMMIDGSYDAIKDIATGQYYDLDLGVDIEPDNTVEDTATVTDGTVTNDTVTVTDVEDITGGFTFSVTQSSDAAGFPGGTLPTDVTTATWTKDVSTSGSVSFTKSVTTTQGYVGTGTLSDVATVSTLAGSELDRASASTELSADKAVDLTVTKKTPMVFSGSDSASFTFQLFEGKIADGELPVAEKTVVVDANSTIAGGKHVVTTTFNDLKPGVYTVRELTQPGWVDQADQEIDLGADDIDCTAGLTFDNTIKLGSIEVLKIDKGTEVPLAGAVFNLWTAVEGEDGLEPGEVIGTETTDGTGMVSWTDLEWGSYFVQEATPPTGYALSDPAIQGPIEINAELNGEPVELTFANPRLPGSIEVLKIDKGTEAPLAGAVFNLWTAVEGEDGLEPGEVIGTETTDGTGMVSWTDLEWGSYFVQEATPPTGYALSDPAIQGPIEINAELNGEPVELTFANPRLPGSIEVLKIDKGTEVPLAGAEFQLWTDVNENGAYDEGVDTVIEDTLKTTGEDGKAKWSDLDWGYYLVQEVTPPTGYALSDPFIQAAVINAALDGGTVELTFANPRLPGSIEVLKIDKGTEAPLAGAVFNLWTAVEGEDGLEPGEVIGTETTDGTGMVSWTDLEWGSYFVQEATPPTGYALSDPAIQGPIEINAELNGEPVELTFANPRLPGSIEVLKIDKGTEVPLAGAEFQLWTDNDKSGDFTEGDTVIEDTLKTTGEDGKAKWSDLDWGYYLVQEVTPPTGYALSDPFIQAAVINAALDGGTVELTFANPRLPGSIEVLKIDKGTEAPLAGAEFQLWTDNDKSGDFTEGDTVIEDTLKTTGEDGKAKWSDLDWGYYLVQEVTPPTGYALSDPFIQAAVINAALDGGTVELTFANPRLPGSIEVLKIDDTETPMGNVTFELFRDANEDGIVDEGESLGQKTTAGDGTATWTDLVWADDYKLTEVSWPTGYVPAGDLVQGPFAIGAQNLTERVTFVNNRIDIPKLDKTSDPAEGTAVEANDTIDYTIEVKNEGALPLTDQTLVDVLPTGVTLDAASVTPAGDTATAGQITWTFDLDAYSAKTFTYTVTVTAGYGTPTLINTVTWVQKELSDKTEHPVKALTAAVTAFCVGDAPFYSLTITPQNGNLFSSQQATVKWYQANAAGQPIDVNGNPTTDPSKYVAAYDPDTKVPYVDTYTLTNGALSLPQLLWKGAEITNGVTTGWPGWEETSPGVWVQVDSGGVRPGMFAVISVNPSVTTAAVYPPAAAPCANPPGVPQLDKTANPVEGTDVAPGGTIDYSILVTNTGGSEFTGPMVDTLPDGFTVDATTISDGGVLSGNTITWQVTLAGGASKTFTYSGTVDLTATADLVNTVVLTTPAGPISDSTIHPIAPVAPIEDVVEPEEEVVAGTEDLAKTGADYIAPLVTAALLALLAGGLMVVFGRRRRYNA